MKQLERKQKDILAYERTFAFKLGEHVLERPKMSLWTILIPFIIVYHIYRNRKYLVARNKFAANFMSARQWALDEAGRVIEDGKEKDVEAVSLQASMPEGARKAHIALIEVLVDHYVHLLRAGGEDIDNLIRSAYGSRSDYLLYLNELSGAESRFNIRSAVLSEDLKERYDIIYGYEQQFAYRLAREVVKKPETSVWMILIPVLFVHHMFKASQYKENVRSFAENILSTRQKALDKAYKEAVGGKRMQYGFDDYFPGVSLSSKQDKVLAEKQIRVIRIMEEHYLAMLKTPGKNLEELIKGVYRDSGQYRRYLDRLTGAETAVSGYLTEYFHVTEEARAVAGNIERQCAVLRELEIEFFF